MRSRLKWSSAADSLSRWQPGCPPLQPLFQALFRLLAVVGLLCLPPAAPGRAVPVLGDSPWPTPAPLPGAPQLAWPAPQPLVLQPLATPSPTSGPETSGAQAAARFFLPLVFKTAWQVPDAPFGIEILRWGAGYVDRVGQAGGSWTRIKLHWSLIEPQNTTPAGYRWPAYLDAMLSQAASRNIQVILTLVDSPSWASTFRSGPIDRVDLGELTEFIQAAVARYGAPPYNVKYWEFYNEPDNCSELWAEQSGFGLFGHNPQAYVDILAAAYRPIKEVDPTAQVLLGGLAYDFWIEDGGVFVRDFLDQVLHRGGGAYFDVMNFHYYAPAFRGRWAPYGDGAGLVGKANYLRQVLASHGQEKPLICTETGWESNPDHCPPGLCSHEMQSRAIHQLMVEGLAAGLHATLWFVLVDAGYWQTGLFDSDLNPKPAFYAYQTMARQLRGAQYVRTLSLAETGSSQAIAYQFTAGDGGTRLIAAWTQDESTLPLRVPTGQLTLIDKFGDQTTLYDGQDGQHDGHVTVMLGPSPVYLRFLP
jgi:hypothetical protein